MSCRSRSTAAPKHHRPQIEASILTTSVLTRWSSTQAPTAKPCAQESLGHQVLHPTPARRRTAWGSPDEDHAARLLESTSYMKGANLPLTLAKDVPGRHAGKPPHLAELHLGDAWRSGPVTEKIGATPVSPRGRGTRERGFPVILSLLVTLYILVGHIP
jgi:hypothetical protein